MNPAEPSSTGSAQGEQQQSPPLPHQSGEQPKAPTAAATGAAAAQKTPRSLACVLCQHRKIKCDKNLPCANCSKVSQVPQPSQISSLTGRVVGRPAVHALDAGRAQEEAASSGSPAEAGAV